MTEYDNTNRGALWDKKPGDKEGAPDLKLDFNFRGEDFSIAYWKRKPTDNPNGPRGRFQIESKTDTHNAGHAQATEAIKDDKIADADDVPF